MKKLINSTDKMTYIQPCIERVKLDNEISLQLESPPEGPGEVFGMNKQEINNSAPWWDNAG
jgi:hypothetical protein